MVAGVIGRALRYFPTRLLLTGAVVTYIALSFLPSLGQLDGYLVASLLNLSGISSRQTSDGLAILRAGQQLRLILPSLSSAILYVFFLSYAISISGPLYVRIKAVLYAILVYFALVVVNFVTILGLAWAGLLSVASFLEASLIVDFLVGNALVVIFLFTTLALPGRVRVEAEVRRSYLRENAFVLLSLAVSVFIIFLILQVFPVRTDSAGNVIAGVSISSVLIPYSVLTYLLRGVSSPKWAKGEPGQWPSVSFLVPAYNESAFIRRTIESIDRAAAKYPGVVDFVIVNDGSKDETSEIAHEAASKTRHCLGFVLDQENTGKSGALNNGARYAKGELIFRMDGDSEVDEDAVALIANRFRDPMVACVSGQILPIEEGSIWQKYFLISMAEFMYGKISGEMVDTITIQPGAFSVFRKSVLVEAGGWAEHIYGEDGDITLRTARLGYAHLFEEKALVYTDCPSTAQQLRRQRLRWNTGYLSTRNRNMGMITENLGPRSYLTLPAELLKSASDLMGFLTIAYIPVAWGMGLPVGFSVLGPLAVFPLNLLTISLPFLIVPYAVFVWFLIRHRKKYLIKYVPFYAIYQDVLLVFLSEAVGRLFPK